MFGKNPIGIIQGRLTASGGKLQCFPHGKWKEEFTVAKSVGFDCIELIVEREISAPNPIWDDGGAAGLIAASNESGVKAFSLCDDQIMNGGLLSEDGSIASESAELLMALIKRIAKVGATKIVLPFLEDASIRRDRKAFLSVKRRLEMLAPIAEASGVAIMLENDLPTDMLLELVSETDGKIGVCYDTGNRTWLGFDPSEEIPALGPLVRHVHIKDKDKEGKNVMLGNGNVDFGAIFSALKALDYGGPLILETSRGDEEVKSGRQNLVFVKNLLHQGLLHQGLANRVAAW